MLAHAGSIVNEQGCEVKKALRPWTSFWVAPKRRNPPGGTVKLK